jgi:hypothetical protein
MLPKLKSEFRSDPKKIQIFFFRNLAKFSGKKKKEYCDFMHDRQFDYITKSLKKGTLAAVI